MSELIYLDHAATTPLRTEARLAMEPFLGSAYGNPSSVHRLGQETRSALDSARDAVATCLGATAAEIVFTSGATEGNNAAIKGVAFANRARGRHLVTAAIEHHSVLHPIEELTERFGFEATVIPVTSEGLVDPEIVARAIRPDTILLSVMWANNEIGTIQPVFELAALARERGVLFHVDAVQAAQTIAINLQEQPADLLTLSAHKLEGPKGTGALFVRRGTAWWPLITGGGQERNRRAGTENVAGAVGFARALELACTERDETAVHLRRLRDALLSGLQRRIPGVQVNGSPEHRLPGNLNVCIEGVHGESLLLALDLAGIAASSGSACASGSTEPSHVLLALGLTHERAQGSLRLTPGRENTLDEIDCAADALEQAVTRLRRLAPIAAEA